MLTHDIGDGSIRIWKDYTSRGTQKLVTAFSSIQGHKPGVRSLNAVVDWQQQSGYLVLHYLCDVTSYSVGCFLYFLTYYLILLVMMKIFFVIYFASMLLVKYHPWHYGISIRSSLLILFLHLQIAASQHWWDLSSLITLSNCFMS